MKEDVTMQDVFDRFLPYIADHYFSPEQFTAIQCISACRTSEMGAHISECENCGKITIHYNSCKNRNCPMCQGMEVEEWIDLRREDVLDAPYFHTVFSIPSQLYPLVYVNQKLLYDALYHAANKTLRELSEDPKHFGAKIGYICILHTWGSKLNYHPHLHTIILGGGLDKLNRWKDKGKQFLFPVKVLSAVFKKYYLEELKELRKSNRLVYAGKASMNSKNCWINCILSIGWCIPRKHLPVRRKSLHTSGNTRTELQSAIGASSELMEIMLHSMPKITAQMGNIGLFRFQESSFCRVFFYMYCQQDLCVFGITESCPAASRQRK